jgi:hypothetical protein
MQCDQILINDNIHVLKQGAELIERLDDCLYTRVNPPLSTHGVGSHFRHCIDFYWNFLAVVETGRVNYDDRERDERVENDRIFAMSKLKAIIEGLQRLPDADIKREAYVILEGSSWSRSSVKRELQFLLSHTIHHYALIAIALRLQGFNPGEGFGVSPSTLEYRRQIAVCVR